MDGLLSTHLWARKRVRLMVAKLVELIARGVKL